MAKDMVDTLAEANDTDMSKARRNQEQFKRALDAGHSDYVERSMKCDDFQKNDLNQIKYLRQVRY